MSARGPESAGQLPTWNDIPSNEGRRDEIQPADGGDADMGAFCFALKDMLGVEGEEFTMGEDMLADEVDGGE
jgi:hypothetical protein